MDKKNLEDFHPEFRFIIIVFILAGLAARAVRYIQVDGKGSSSSNSHQIVKLEQEIRSCREVLREYQTSLISLSKEVEQLKQQRGTSPCDFDRKRLLCCCLRSEYDDEGEKREDEMVEQVEKRVRSWHTSTTDQHDNENSTLAHTPSGIIIDREEPGRLDDDVLLKPATATATTAQIVEMGRAKLVYIEKPPKTTPTPTPSEEDIHTVTRLHIQKNIHKPKVLRLREK